MDRPRAAHGAVGHRTWLHLLPEDPSQVLSAAQLRDTRDLLQRSGLALPGPEAEVLAPGPAFARLLLPPRRLPLAGQVRGEVRLEAGVLRCYPDPGPLGFDTEPPRSYLGLCPGCAGELNFYRLSFPFPDPMQAACPGCRRAVAVTEVGWSPELPVACSELTFGDLEGRPSLRGSSFLEELALAWGGSPREALVTL